MASIGKYELYKTLGAGGFAKVKLGLHMETEELAAMKIMRRGEEVPEAFFNLIKTEVEVL